MIIFSKKYLYDRLSIYYIAQDIPILHKAHHYLKHSTNKELPVKTDFNESLTHDSIILQVEAIKKKHYKNELKKAVSVF